LIVELGENGDAEVAIGSMLLYDQCLAMGDRDVLHASLSFST
jgi:hypothetical protein